MKRLKSKKLTKKKKIRLSEILLPFWHPEK
jgi:hypothetical protein